MIKALFIVIIVSLAADSIVCRRVPTYQDLERVSGELKKIVAQWTRDIDLLLILELSRVVDKSRDTCQNFQEKVKNTVADVKKCQDEIKVGSSTVCETVKAIITKCSAPARQLLSDCLPIEHKEVPFFLQRILVSLIKQFCGITIEELTEFFNPCQFKRDVRSFESCRKLPDFIPRQFPNTEQLCGLLKQLKVCSYDVHSASCTNPITLNSFAKFHRTIEEDTESFCPNKTINEV